jgi:hypothetical protein
MALIDTCRSKALEAIGEWEKLEPNSLVFKYDCNALIDLLWKKDNEAGKKREQAGRIFEVARQNPPPGSLCSTIGKVLAEGFDGSVTSKPDWSRLSDAEKQRLSREHINKIRTPHAKKENHADFLASAKSQPDLCAVLEELLSSYCEQFFVQSVNSHDLNHKTAPLRDFNASAKSFGTSEYAMKCWALWGDAIYDMSSADALRSQLRELAETNVRKMGWVPVAVSREKVGVDQRPFQVFKHHPELVKGFSDDGDTYVLRSFKMLPLKDQPRHWSLFTKFWLLWRNLYLQTQEDSYALLEDDSADSDEHNQDEQIRRQPRLRGLSRMAQARLLYLSGYMVRMLLRSKEFSFEEKQILIRWFAASQAQREMTGTTVQLIMDTDADADNRDANADDESADDINDAHDCINMEVELPGEVADDCMNAHEDDDQLEDTHSGDEQLIAETAARLGITAADLDYDNEQNEPSIIPVYAQAMGDQKTFTYTGAYLHQASPPLHHYCSVLEGETATRLNFAFVIKNPSRSQMAEKIEVATNSALQEEHSPIYKQFEQMAEEYSTATTTIDFQGLRMRALTKVVRVWVLIRLKRWLQRRRERKGKGRKANTGLRGSLL